MKIRTYKAYTTHSLTAALEMYSELVRRMKKGESLDVRDCPGIRIKVDDVKLPVVQRGRQNPLRRVCHRPPQALGKCGGCR